MKISFSNGIESCCSRRIVYLINDISFVSGNNVINDNIESIVKASYDSKGNKIKSFCIDISESEKKEIFVVCVEKCEKDKNYNFQDISENVLKCIKDFKDLGGKDDSVSIVPFLCENDKNNFIINVAYNLLLKSYKFNKYKTKEDDKKLLPNVFCIVDDADFCKKEFVKYYQIADGVFFAKDLVSEPANNLTPLMYLERIQSELIPLGVQVEVLDEKKMKEIGMNALIGVAQGSINSPLTIIMKWNGLSKNENVVALVGKGVTFDSGGLSLKPSGSMEDMKTDMAGSAVVVGIMKILASRNANVNVIGAIGLVENMPSGSAQRPGDVVKSLSGKTIEILNTDAEGRLVLADVLWYVANTFKPSVMIDVATLTGAAVVALGSSFAALMSNDDDLVDKIIASSKRTKELVWQLPLPDEYDKYIDSEIADVRNTSTLGGAGTITAGKFLQRFVNNVKWAHLDIAAVAWGGSSKNGKKEKGATGFGVELLNDFISSNYEN